MPVTDFWSYMAAVENAQPYTQESIELLLGVALELESENEYTAFYRLKAITRPPKFANILGVDLRIRKTRPWKSGFLSIDLADCGISFEAVKNRYPGSTFEPARPGPPPHGVSPESANYLTVERSWGSLSFGFRVKNPDALARIVFDPKQK